ncbi:MAG: hypothetical protein KDN18_21070, partial [Verrucomicrobiae bacterium]|nr:hypothetical protein [Verrucomicrobiae bacterium]
TVGRWKAQKLRASDQSIFAGEAGALSPGWSAYTTPKAATIPTQIQGIGEEGRPCIGRLGNTR